MDEVARDIAQLEKRNSTSISGFFGRKKVLDAKNSAISVGVLFGSHNWQSVKLILDSLVEKRLASVTGLHDGEAVIQVRDEVAERVTMAQLYGMFTCVSASYIGSDCFVGMCDALTNYIVDRTRSSSPMVLKYVPYGALEEVRYISMSS